MRHRKLSQRLSRPMGHRQATLRNLVIALLRYQKIKTTKAKAKFAQSLAERLISLAKQDSLRSRRHAFKILNDRIAVGHLFSRIAPLFKSKTSGATRIIRYSRRRGDGAEMVFLELTEKLPKHKPKVKEVKKERPAKEEVSPEKTEEPAVGAKPKQAPKPPKPKPVKKIKPKKFLGGLRRLFKKERDSL
ncbi:MAG: 50S ribosomal protein L17 [Candidatus Omnitrophica bacterium]|nr:50S ribosomal protein L17 [Candidatus Omnitrophota bacterium]